MTLLAPLTLAAATGLMAAAPLLPAGLELRNREEACPLPIRTDNGHAENFARAFAASLEPFAAEMEKCAATGEVAVVFRRDGSRVLLVAGDSSLEQMDAAGSKDVTAIAFCGSHIAMPAGRGFTADAYFSGDLETRSQCAFRGLFCRGSASLGPFTRVARWVHAGGTLRAGEYSALFGRASAGESISLGMACRFGRLHAPVIQVGLDEVPLLRRPSQFPGRSIMDLKLGRVMASGDFRLDCGDVLQGHVIAAGSVRVSAGSSILGSIKSHHNAHIGAGCEIQGAVVSSAALHISGGSHIRGPVIAEKELDIGAATQIGSPDAPTSVSAPRIRIAPGCVVYGTLWAREGGLVEAEL
ncbi:MAG: polymer-forming cytoskeletal protein [Acidobacteria bacterium]|nr:polymer-forming cytoskeletal protein [Acidobacteriota bacterium]